MRNNITKYVIFSASLAFLSLKLTSPVSAAIRYPIPELSNCRNQKECQLYCEIPKNSPACWAYAKYGPPSQVLGVTAVTDKELANKYGITFPIAELGNCASITDCREFCQNDTNKSVCTDFALKKNLQKTRAKDISSNILQKAKFELGCISATSCHNYCRKADNQEICKSFGEKYDLIKKSASPAAFLKPDFWQNSRDELGCSDQVACKNLCANTQNFKRCAAFAAKYALSKLSGSQKSAIARELIGSGLCKNEVECAAYCQKNPNQCPGYATASAIPQGQKDAYLGPGGCRTDKECYEYCIAHPQECPNFPNKFSSFGQLPKTSPTKSLPKPTETPAAEQ